MIRHSLHNSPDHRRVIPSGPEFHGVLGRYRERLLRFNEAQIYGNPLESLERGCRVIRDKRASNGHIPNISKRVLSQVGGVIGSTWENQYRKNALFWLLGNAGNVSTTFDTNPALRHKQWRRIIGGFFTDPGLHAEHSMVEGILYNIKEGTRIGKSIIQDAYKADWYADNMMITDFMLQLGGSPQDELSQNCYQLGIQLATGETNKVADLFTHKLHDREIIPDGSHSDRYWRNNTAVVKIHELEAIGFNTMAQVRSTLEKGIEYPGSPIFAGGSYEYVKVGKRLEYMLQYLHNCMVSGELNIEDVTARNYTPLSDIYVHNNGDSGYVTGFVSNKYDIPYVVINYLRPQKRMPGRRRNDFTQLLTLVFPIPGDTIEHYLAKAGNIPMYSTFTQ